MNLLRQLSGFNAFVLLAFLAQAAPVFASELEQDYRVAKSGETFLVVGAVDSETLFESEQAHVAIQYAVDALGDAGGQVILSRGDYPLDEPIMMDDRIHLSGSGRATRLLVSEANTKGNGIVCRDINGFIISDLAISAGENAKAKIGLLMDNCGDSKVRDIFSVGFAHYGIMMVNNCFLNEITGCHLAGNKKANFYAKDLMRGKYGDFIPNLVANCMIYGGGKGIELNRVNVMNIVGCSVYQTNDTGFYINNWSNSVLITGSRTFQITGAAVVVEGSMEVNITGNIFCWSTEQSILLKKSRWGNVTGNNIIDAGSYNTGKEFSKSTHDERPEDALYYDGVEMIDVHGFHVGGNTIFNWDAVPKMRNGISEDADSRLNIIANNNINYFIEEAVISRGIGTEVHGNVIFKDIAHVRMKAPFMQSFRTEMTEQFIELQQK
jgi:hypothetical protein